MQRSTKWRVSELENCTLRQSKNVWKRRREGGMYIKNMGEGGEEEGRGKGNTRERVKEREGRYATELNDTTKETMAKKAGR